MWQVMAGVGATNLLVALFIFQQAWSDGSVRLLDNLTFQLQILQNAPTNALKQIKYHPRCTAPLVKIRLNLKKRLKGAEENVKGRMADILCRNQFYLHFFTYSYFHSSWSKLPKVTKKLTKVTRRCHKAQATKKMPKIANKQDHQRWRYSTVNNLERFE